MNQCLQCQQRPDNGVPMGAMIASAGNPVFPIGACLVECEHWAHCIRRVEMGGEPGHHETEPVAITDGEPTPEAPFLALDRHVPAEFHCVGASDPHCLACRPARSEEHTSELQSLMRISYA